MSLAADSDDLPINLNLAELKEQLSQNGTVICPVQGCNQDFKSLWGLKYHLRRANHQDVPEGKFKCEQCNQLFQSRVNLRQHRIADHSGSEGGSPLHSPLSSPRSGEKDSLHFSSANSNQSTKQITNTEISCTEVSKSSVTNGVESSENKVNQSQATVVIKRKKGRPKKADQIKNSPLASTNGQGEVISGTLCLSQTVINTGADNPEGIKLDNASSDNTVTPRRASTRLRTPRKNLNLCDDAEENKRKRKRVKGNSPKKRGRKPKIVSDENVVDDSVRDSDCEKIQRKKPATKQKSNTAGNECDIGKGTNENVDGNSDNTDDENDDVHEDNAENVDNEENDNHDEDDDDGKAVVKERRKPRKKRKAVSEATRLKRLVKYGKSLICQNEGCRAKFTTAAGYLAHQKICGVKEEDREKFVCEICEKVYMSSMGLKYHMQAKHTESETLDSCDNSEDKNEGENEPEILPDGRTRRKAASRAMSKVQKLVTEQDLQEVNHSRRIVKKEFLDQLIVKIKGRDISKQEEQWTEALEKETSVMCPSKGCSETFQSFESIKAHLKSCENAVSYKCLACSKVYLSIMLLHNHINFRHVGFKPKGKDQSDSSDVDYVVVSSGDSAEESDNVEIEEIEESGSDLNEDLENRSEEIIVWDDKRKKFKRPGMPKAFQRSRSGPTSAVKFGSIGSTDSESYETTENWRKKEFKHKDLFPNFKPSSSYWSRVDHSEIKQYLPEATVSPKFTIRRKGENHNAKQDMQLPLFESTSKEESSVYGDVTFNVGGSVWAMAWCPVPDSNSKADQFLAIGTHRSLDEVHKLHKCVSTKGLIQIWNVGQLNMDSARSGSKPTFVLGIAHDYGAIWDISWCPSGTWEPASSKKNQTDVLPRLGVMAVACGDGLVRILSIPWPSALLSALDAPDSDKHSRFRRVIVSPTPHAVLMPCALGVTYNGQSGQAWRAKWFPCAIHEKIATGFSDGTVAIWNLLKESPLLKERMDGGTQTFRLAPFLHIAANSSVVKDLAWCPQYPEYLVTGSYDRWYKIWNLNSPLLPVTVLKRGISHELHWSVGFGSIVSCEDDSFQNQKYPCVARFFTFVNTKDERLTSLATAHNSAIYTLSLSDWTKVLITGDASGEVIGVQLAQRKRRPFSKFSIYRAYLEELDGGTSSLPKEQEPKDVTSIDDTNNFGILDESQVNQSIHKSLDTSTFEERGACAKDDENSCTSKEASTSEEKKSVPPPKTAAEVFQNHRLVFHDVNALEFQNSIERSDPDFRRLLSPSTMQSVQYDSFVNPQAIHKVRFNPNKQSFTWLATGGGTGLVRLHLVKEVKP